MLTLGCLPSVYINAILHHKYKIQKMSYIQETNYEER